jgi:hypothetical protein
MLIKIGILLQNTIFISILRIGGVFLCFTAMFFSRNGMEIGEKKKRFKDF